MAAKQETMVCNGVLTFVRVKPLDVFKDMSEHFFTFVSRDKTRFF